ncbi:MAG: hypothetical protein JWM57_2944 [Phycisphaerales bacterium]|nr:hypothetical protein [Phycisphaerales bacterium]
MILEEALSEKVIGALIEVHRESGPGLLESAYEQCVCHELTLRGLRFGRQVPVPMLYKGLRLECGFRADIIVEDRILIELKACNELHSIHEAQVLTYLKLSGIRVGLLVNFNVDRLVNGIKRMVN